MDFPNLRAEAAVVAPALVAHLVHTATEAVRQAPDPAALRRELLAVERRHERTTANDEADVLLYLAACLASSAASEHLGLDYEGE